MMIKLVIFACVLISGIHAFPSGADPSACSQAGMVPSGHGPTTTGNEPSPYGIELKDVTQWTQGEAFNVTLKGSGTFKGFLILALPENDAFGSSVGSFEAADPSQNNLVQPLCGNGLTHQKDFGSANTNEIVLKWTAPTTAVGNIIFYATFVKTQNEYWVKQPSAPVWDGVGPKPTTTTQPSVITDPSPLDPAISQEGCGVNGENGKSCYRDCSGDDCGYILTWKRATDTTVEFELFASLREEEGYVALGLGKGPTMSDVSIIACTADNTRTSKVEQYYTPDRSQPSYEAAGPINAAESQAAIKTSGGRTMSCRFTYDNAIAKAALDKWKDLDGELHAFIARGPYSPRTLSKHTVTPDVSPQAVQFTSTNASLTPPKDVTTEPLPKDVTTEPPPKARAECLSAYWFLVLLTLLSTALY